MNSRCIEVSGSKRVLPEAILLDHDGTLVDSEAVHFKLWEALLVQYNAVLSKRVYVSELVGLSEWDSARYLKNYFGLDETAESLLGQKHAAVEAFQSSQAFPVLPSVNACLNLWHQSGIRLAVVSGSNQKTVCRSVSACGWDGLIEGVFTGDQVAQNKPSPDVYQLALRRLGVSARNVVAVEDSCTGLSAATAAGIPCYVVSNGWSSGQNFSAALEVVSSMGAVRESLMGSLDVLVGT